MIIVYRALSPLLRLAFHVLALLGNEKIREGLRMRRDSPWLKAPKGQRPVWIHCASGEFEYAKPVITALKRERPDVAVLVTFFSPTIAKAVRSFPGVDFATPAPWESAGVLAEFIKHHEPRALLIARTDTWPEMLSQAKAAGLPTLLFSATLPRRSGRARGLGRVLSRLAFSKLDQIFCVSEDDREVFASLGFASRAKLAGDTRYDQVRARLENPRPLKDELFGGRILVAGSTWTEDEIVLVEAASSLKRRVRFVLVPHEPTALHLKELEERLRTAGLSSIRYTEARAFECDVLIVDQVGILAELYAKGAFAFVGGSFRKTVHSVMEPLAAGALTFVGPLHLNNREAIEFRSVPSGIGELSCVVEVANARELVSAVERAFDHDAKVQIQNEIQKRTGRSALVMDWIRSKL